MANYRGGYLKRSLVSTFTHTNTLAHENAHTCTQHTCMCTTCTHMEGTRAVGSFQTLTCQRQINCMITCYTDLQACEMPMRPRSSYMGSTKTRLGCVQEIEPWRCKQDSFLQEASPRRGRAATEEPSELEQGYWGGLAQETAAHPPSHIFLPLPPTEGPEHKNFSKAVKCWAESRAGATNLVPLEGNNKNPTRQKGSNHCLCHWSMPEHFCLAPTFTPWRPHRATRS